MTIMEDKRSIEAAWTDTPDEVGATVGYEGVTKITPYWEDMGVRSVWLKIWKGDFLWQRLNVAHLVQIRYKEG